MKETIKNLIFDFGGVLVNLDKQCTIEAFARLGFDARPYIGTYAQGGLFQRLEMGTDTPAEFCEAVRKAASNDRLTDKQISDAWNRMLVGIPAERLERLLQLRQSHRIFLLSNTNAIHWQMACETLFRYGHFQVENFFDKIFLSFQMHQMKPDAAIFQTLLDDTAIVPAETLFIDDSEANCATARTLGIDTFCPKQPHEWMEMMTD